MITINIPSRWQAFKWHHFRLIPISGLIPFILPNGGYIEFMDWNIKLIYRDIIISDIFTKRPIMKVYLNENL